MKKIYIAMAVVATAALASCQQEKSFNDENLGENSVVFAIRSGSTRSAAVASETRRGIVIPLETEDGSQFVLEETVTSLDQFSPATKGAPAYTENLGTLYANDLNVWGDKGGFRTDATYVNMENSQYPRKDTDLGSGWRYNHDYSGDPWPDETTDVGFYLNMPAAPTGVSITGHTGGKFTFTYTSPATAAAQQDILFAYRATNKSDYLDDFHPNGIPVLFNHALTAVKFAIGNTDADISANGIKITKITFKDLVDKGTCTITPASEDDYKDNEGTYSSATAAVWTGLSASGNDITSDTYGGTVNYTSGENNEFGASWYSAGNQKNLNDADGTQTFWLVPQKFDASSAMKLEIVYDINGTTGNKWEIDFGKFLANVTWKAGELRTYTIKVNDVNVTITDQFTTAQKNNVQIKNTGNTAAFIRASIIGQWVDDDNQPIFGFTEYTGGVPSPASIPSWHQDFVSGNEYFGSFVNLATSASGWVKNDVDGYYYYTVPVEPGNYTNPLFDAYNINEENIPQMRVGGIYKDCYLLIEVATQAVSAKTLDGSYRMDGDNYDYMGTWNEAKTLASSASYVTNASSNQ